MYVHWCGYWSDAFRVRFEVDMVSLNKLSLENDYKYYFQLLLSFVVVKHSLINGVNPLDLEIRPGEDCFISH